MLLIDPEFKRIEPRGSLTQLSSQSWKQFNILEIKASRSFGGHYHKKKRELFYVVKGAIILTIADMLEKDPAARETFSFGFYPGDAFIVEPFEYHSLFGLEDAIIAVLLSSKHDPKDTYDEL